MRLKLSNSRQAARLLMAGLLNGQGWPNTKRQCNSYR
jgi:hypothetical protein